MQSAASLGVTYDRYGELLIKADSTLNFEKTKLPDPDYRHSQYLSYAKDAIRNYSKANEAWNSYLKYEWMREKKQALMHDWNFRDLRECGVNVDETTYPPALNIKGAYLVPFNECLSLYWKAADIIIEKMKGEISK